MIGSLRGTLLDRSLDGEILIEVQGVGYRVQAGPATSARLGDASGVTRCARSAGDRSPGRLSRNAQLDHRAGLAGRRLQLRIGQHRGAAAIGRPQVEGDLARKALQPQQRRIVGLVEDAAARGQHILQPQLALDRRQRPAAPLRGQRIGAQDQAFGRGVQVAALRLVGQQRQIAGGDGRLHAAARRARRETKPSIAAMVSAGALRCGQWPVAFMRSSSASGSVRCR